MVVKVSLPPPPPALSVLQDGIGDTIRISVDLEPGGDRCKESVCCAEILQTMGLKVYADGDPYCHDNGHYYLDRIPNWQTRFSLFA